MKAPLSERQGSDRFKKSNKNPLTNKKSYDIISLSKVRKVKEVNHKKLLKKLKKVLDKTKTL